MTWEEMCREKVGRRREEFRKALARMARARHQYISLPDEGGELEYKPHPAQERLHQADELKVYGYSLTFIADGPTRAEVDEVCQRVARESGLTLD